ncbi:hypothetical protein D3C80_1850250 [compost metagenome]
MTVRIINLLEMIQIKQGRGKSPLRPPEVRNQLLHRLIKELAVIGTGQLIYNNRLLPFFFQLKAVLDQHQEQVDIHRLRYIIHHTQ